MKSLIFFLLLCFLTTNLSAKRNNKEENNKCFRCHSWSTLGYRDSNSSILINLSVNQKDFYSSNHRNLACIDCHSKDFRKFPHPAKLKKEGLYCLNCHKDNKKFSVLNFKIIEADFKESIHYKKFGNEFTCFNCHDPHIFKINARKNSQISQTVMYDNQICLSCHNNINKIELLSRKVVPALNEVHDWLPHLKLHLANVRCIDCHTYSNTPGVSHLIVAKENAVKDCVNCHSENSLLLHTLYKFQSKQNRTEQGFINAIILNNSYIIGATRNYYLNLFSFIIFGIVIIALVTHGYLRYKSNKVMKNEKQ